MNEIVFYFEVSEKAGMAFDRNGAPAKCGLSMNLGKAPVPHSYSELMRKCPQCREATSEMTHGFVKPDDLRIITPEEYQRLYGEDSDDHNAE